MTSKPGTYIFPGTKARHVVSGVPSAGGCLRAALAVSGVKVA
jgi:hypothetical protein